MFGHNFASYYKYDKATDNGYISHLSQKSKNYKT